MTLLKKFSLVLMLVAFNAVHAATPLFEQTLVDILKDPKQKPLHDAAEIILTVANFTGDAEAKAIKNKEQDVIEGRENEADTVIDTLVRMKSRAPVLVAPPGIGKTATAQRAIQKIIQKLYPEEPAFEEALDKAFWIQITPGRLLRIAKPGEMGRMKAIEDFFDSVIAIENSLGIKIITFMDELHSLEESQVEALLPYLESQTKSIRFVGASNADKLSLKFKDNEAFLRRLRQIPLAEFDDETTLRLVDASWIPKIQKKYDVKFADDAKKRLIRFGTILNPDGGKFDAAIKIAQDLAIWNQRKEEDRKAILEQSDLFQFFKAKTGFPVDPFNADELQNYLGELNSKVSKKLVGQDRMTKDVLEVFRDIILGTKKEMGVITIVGPSGTGKSELGKMIAVHGFNNPRSFLKIDGTEYSTEGDGALNKLFGAAGGLVTSNTRLGIFPEYFDDPSQGKYGGVILIDEAEKASPKFWQRLMEFFEEGTFRGGDGRIRKARRHLVILTSNRGDTILFPEGMKKLEKARITEYASRIEEKDIKRLFQIKTSGTDEFQIPTPVLNRIDRYTVSTPLHRDDVEKIAENFSAGQMADIEDLFQIEMKVQPSLVNRVAQTAFDPQYGARPIERALTRLFNQIKDKLLASKAKFKGKTLKVEENRISEDEAEAIVSLNDKELFRFELPRVELDEPLLSTGLQEKITRISDILPKTVIGQEDALRRVRDVLINYLSTPVKKRSTLGIMLVGLTGVGKTETAKATAEAMFGGQDQAEVIPMGEIGHESEFNNIIGSPPGYLGSDQVRKFEQALMAHPDGGVIVLDEVTNMGGGDKGVKEALFKRLYNFFEEGKWTSAATGTTYDLTKYIFFLTGNDGEHLFRGASDPVRMEAWKEANKSAYIHSMLVKKGVPEPFLGRLADTILMKPLLRKETGEIAHKLLMPVLGRFEGLGYKLDLPENFDEEFGKTFFTPEKGARSLRNVVQMRLATAVSEALILAQDNLKKAKNKWIKVRIANNQSKKPYIDDDKFEPEVNLVVTVGAGEKEFASITRKTTDFAAIDKKLGKDQAIRTAYHEAGHAVLNDPQITGVVLKHLTILGYGNNLGYALYGDKKGPNYRPVHEEQMLALIARVMGGQVATVLSGHEPDGGWGMDLEMARKYTRNYVMDVALDKEFLGLILDEKGSPILSPTQIDKISGKMEKMIIKGIDQAAAILIQRWDLVEAIVASLLDTGIVTEKQFVELREKWEKSPAAKKPKAQPKEKDCAKFLYTPDKSAS